MSAATPFKKPVYIAFQENAEAAPIIEAIAEDNPDAIVHHYPAMVRIESGDRITVKRASVERRLLRDWDPQELHLHLISISGNVYETDDEFTLSWNKP